jgi:tetratricopeptide (TPR) repeat protein
MLNFEPGNEILAEDALQTPDDLQKLLLSCYDVMTNTYYGAYQNLGELLSANLESPRVNNDYTEVYNRATIFFNGTVGSLYGEPYVAIFRANTLLESFDYVEGLSSEDQQRIEGEAKFIRAIGHFDLVNLFAQPFGYTADNSQLGIVIKENSSFDIPPRSSVADVYDFIISDLNDAVEKLPEVNGIYANKYAAQAMLARVYFQMNDFENAAAAAEVVINEGPYVLDSLNARWSGDISTENIFTLVVLESEGRTSPLITNYRSDNNDIPELYASNSYVEGLYGPVIPTSDQRSLWFTKMDPTSPDYYYNIAKFNNNYFNIPYLYLTEILLIHAESLAEMGTDIFTAVDDINMVRARAGVSLLNENADVETVINASRVERAKEFIGEGRYVFDLKRRGALGEDITIRGAPWNCNGMVLQFPISENTSNFVMNPTGGCN